MRVYVTNEDIHLYNDIGIVGLWMCNHRLPLDGRVSQGYSCNVMVDLPVKHVITVRIQSLYLQDTTGMT